MCTAPAYGVDTFRSDTEYVPNFHNAPEINNPLFSIILLASSLPHLLKTYMPFNHAEQIETRQFNHNQMEPVNQESTSAIYDFSCDICNR